MSGWHDPLYGTARTMEVTVREILARKDLPTLVRLQAGCALVAIERLERAIMDGA